MKFEIFLEHLKVSAIIGILPSERENAQDLEICLALSYEVENVKDAEVCTADFLLEAKKLGSPTKAKKAPAFWCVGGSKRERQPFLQKESSEFKGQNGDSNDVNIQNMCCYNHRTNAGFASKSHNATIVDYAILREMVLEIFKKNQFLYLENALVAIQNAILARFSSIIALDLSIEKLHIFSDCTPKVCLKWSKND